jgi:hypothetical protein
MSTNTEAMFIEFTPALPWPEPAANEPLSGRRYQVVITMPDGSRGEHLGHYPDGSSAVMAAAEIFPQAKRISALRAS